MSTQDWYSLKNPQDCISPSLLVYPQRIDHNIREMIRVAGGTSHLRPHVKTHKMAEVIAMQQSHGIHKFKCATIAEAELLGKCSAGDVLMAYQPVGKNLPRLLALKQAYPGTAFSVILDDSDIARQLNRLAAEKGMKVGVYMDVNVGMDRTGVSPESGGQVLFKHMMSLPQLNVKGFHVYDGHIRHSSLEERTRACHAAFRKVLNLRQELRQEGLDVTQIVAGGSPTFPIHALREEVETSPGTTLLWDHGYGTAFPDMNFLPAAVLLCRVISKPGKGLLCLDLGHKAIAPEMPFPRLHLLGMENCEQLSQSEEHLVVKCAGSENYRPGDVCYAIPMHICPTVAKYPEVLTVEGGTISGSWRVAARDHKISI